MRQAMERDTGAAMTSPFPQAPELPPLSTMPDIGLGSQSRSFIQDWHDRNIEAARAPLLAENQKLKYFSDQNAERANHAFERAEAAQAEIERLQARKSDEEILVRMLAACVKAEKAERERDERAAWLAQFVIDRHDGTHDLPAWVAQSSRFWRELCKERDELRAQLEAVILALRQLLDIWEAGMPDEAARQDMVEAFAAVSTMFEVVAARASKEDPLAGKLGMWPIERLK